eukprot:TRINITY_DN9786_c0_g1_i1.p1 TRINITY_DN9786_c0_g1~~TRINITY_DN9786_c0_g1_i1.p1  ORF type:complete len:320 (+),score=68.45 TRINITY_DN9786_c0_g1_i1:37-996(+)
MCGPSCRIVWAVLFSILAISFVVFRQPHCTLQKYNLDGKIAIITGANTGIGLWSAKLLAEMGAHVVVACRNIEKSNFAKQWIEANATRSVKITPMVMDLGSFKSILNFVGEYQKKFNKIDILMNNAGLANFERKFTSDGLEEIMGVNHVGHFLLTTRLLELIKKSKSKIINVSSDMHFSANPSFIEDLNGNKSFGGIVQYANSKLANNLFSLELQRRLKGTGVCTYSVHPGGVSTEFGRFMDGPIKFLFDLISALVFKTPEQGATTQVRVASDPTLANECGKYWSHCQIANDSGFSKNSNKAKQLWEETEKLIAQKLKE